MKSCKDDIRIVFISLFNLDFGVRYISSFLKKEGYPAYIISFNKQRHPLEILGNDYFTPHLIKHDICSSKNLALLIPLLRKLKARIVGISVSSVTMQTAKYISKEIKKHLDVILVWGGIHAIISPQQCLEYSDVVCTGEGEHAMLELAEKLRHDQPINGIKNLWIKNKDGIQKNEMRSLINNLDELSFPDFVDRDNKFLIDNGQIIEDPLIASGFYKGVYPIMTSRGCLYSCAYCCNSVLRQRYKGCGSYFRRRSVGDVIGELKTVMENKTFYQIRFWDDIFTCDTEWVLQFCDRYIKEIGKRFSCYCHPKHTEGRILKELKRIGLSSVTIGLQSGSEEVAKNIFLRTQSNRDILRFDNSLRQLGIAVVYDIISDNPYESDQDQNKNVELLLELTAHHHINLHSLCWFPDTPLTKRALSDKIISSKDLEHHTSKALNNFYMFLPLSRNKRDFFWNCIKAMAVNRHFPKFLVRFCKKSRFFRKHPKILFFLGRHYLLFFTKFGIKLKGKKIIIEKKISIKTSDSIAYYNRDYPGHILVNEDPGSLVSKVEIEYSFFPVGSIKKTKIFCLKIRQRFRKNQFLNLRVSINPFDKELNSSSNISVWEIGFHTGDKYKTDVYFNLSYPELTYSINNCPYKANLIKAQPFLLNSRIYVIVLRHAGRLYEPIGKICFKA